MGKRIRDPRLTDPRESVRADFASVNGRDGGSGDGGDISAVFRVKGRAGGCIGAQDGSDSPSAVVSSSDLESS